MPGMIRFPGYDLGEKRDLSYWPKWVNAITIEYDTGEIGTGWNTVFNHAIDEMSERLYKHFGPGGLGHLIRETSKVCRYKPDGLKKDVWKTPIQSLWDRGGDCEDISILWYEIIRRTGNWTGVILGESFRFGYHAVCIVDSGPKYLVLDPLCIIPLDLRMSSRIFRPIILLEEDGWRRFTPQDRLDGTGTA